MEEEKKIEQLKHHRGKNSVIKMDESEEGWEGKGRKKKSF